MCRTNGLLPALLHVFMRFIQRILDRQTRRNCGIKSYFTDVSRKEDAHGIYREFDLGKESMRPKRACREHEKIGIKKNNLAPLGGGKLQILDINFA